MRSDLGVPDGGDFLADLLGLPERAEDGLSEIEAAFVGRYGGPSRLQRAVQAVVLGGHSCLIVAPPASGKTEAAVIPLAALQRVSERAILYICPTRALINDVVARLDAGFAALGRTVVARHGESKKSAGAYARASCVVLTPESLDSMAVSDDPLLQRVGYLVIDELHSIDGTARGTHLRVVLGRLRRRLDAPPLTIGLSATVSDPRGVAELWGSTGEPLRIIGFEGRPGRASVQVLDGGVDGLRGWLQRSAAPAKVLAFANSRRHCDELFLALKGTSQHVPLIHYSDLERADRLATEDLLRALPRVICIATSTLELGIDVGDIDSVVLADAPWSTRNLFQRIGRGGRRSGQTDTVFFPQTDRDLLRALAALGTPILEDDDGVSPIFPSVLIQQVLVTIMADSRRRIGPLALEGPVGVVGVAASWASELLAHLRDQGVLMTSPGGRKYELTLAAERLIGSDVWGNFPADSGGWELRVSGRRLATVRFRDRPFVGLGILFAGRTWRVVAIQRRALSLVQDDNVVSPESPSYRDPSPLVSGRLAEQMSRLLAGASLPPGVELEDGAASRVDELRQQLGGLVGQGAVMVRGERGLKLLTFAGSRVNHLLAATMADSAGADDTGIHLNRPLSSAAWAKIASRTERPALADGVWQQLAGQISLNRWFEYLPTPLKRDEVVSQFVSPEVLDRLRAVVNRSIVSSLDHPVSL